MRSRPALILACSLSLVATQFFGAPALAAQPTSPVPGPHDDAKAAEAGQQARQRSNIAAAQVAGDGTTPVSYSVARVFATQYAPNTPGSVEVALPDKCAKFAALGNSWALRQYACPSGYAIGLDYRVVVATDNGRQAVLPLGDAGPWNADDNYWDFGPGAPRPRRLFTDLPPQLPESQAAFSNGYNTQPNCKTLGGAPSGRAGGADQFGRCVLNPAGIDLSVAAASALGLGPGQNAWVNVVFLWEQVRNNIVSVNSGKQLDVYNASTADGAPVVQWQNNGGRHQQWRFEAATATTFRIVSSNSGKVLDVYQGSSADGTPVVQWPWHGGPNQQWRFEPVGENQVRIVSVATGKVLDINGGSLDDGARLIQWTWHGGNNQRWQLNVVGTGS
ncbi:MAG: RICIN domain-containing protein [Actinomycetota bacterium]|nr:RICIN domain-containing protein [Actinomycetota bacterium]